MRLDIIYYLECYNQDMRKLFETMVTCNNKKKKIVPGQGEGQKGHGWGGNKINNSLELTRILLKTMWVFWKAYV